MIVEGETTALDFDWLSASSIPGQTALGQDTPPDDAINL